MIGEIEGVRVGQLFADRKALHAADVHRGLMRGIAPGGYSIVLSGGYVDDEDNDDVIIYTGEGGRDSATGRQIADQTLTGGNLALANNCQEGIPIRVSRGSKLDSPYAPKTGYRYDGLYRIDDCWHEKGADGFMVWRYRLTKLPRDEQPEPLAPADEKKQLTAPAGQEQPGRAKVYTTRVIRNSDVGNHVKSMYGHTCQISGVRLDAPAGPYAEACHIQPVGKPHNGPDTVGNVLCLSPNMHVLFDLGAISLTDDFRLLGMSGELSVNDAHKLSLECIRYHRDHIYKGVPR